MNAPFVVAGIAVAVLLLTWLASYNGLIHHRHEIRVAWARMDEQLKQRYGLVSTLVALGQSSGGDLATKMPAIAAARNQAAVAFDPAQLATAEAALTVAIHLAITAIETNPDLKVDLRLASIHAQLIANQKLISQTCRRYNEKVDALNSAMSSFPQVITAKAIGLRLQPMFNVVE